MSRLIARKSSAWEIFFQKKIKKINLRGKNQRRIPSNPQKLWITLLITFPAHGAADVAMRV
jgi:PIN domain nuclease of toxin-antitoxin system